jgi:hypothetical protein
MQRNNPDPSSFSVESNFADSMTQLNRLKTLKAAADDETNIPELVASLTRMATSLIRGKIRRGIVEQFKMLQLWRNCEPAKGLDTLVLKWISRLFSKLTTDNCCTYNKKQIEES